MAISSSGIHFSSTFSSASAIDLPRSQPFLDRVVLAGRLFRKVLNLFKAYDYALDHVIPVFVLDAAVNDGKPCGPIFLGDDVVVLRNGQIGRFRKRTAAKLVE